LIPTGEQPQPYGTDTDDQGRFQFPAVPAGKYVIVPRRAGMAFERLDPTDPPVPNLTLKAGERKEIRLGMTHKAVISGRVTDDAGVPIDSAVISIQSASDDQRAVQYYVWHYLLGTQIRTDDRGEYRVSVPPGNYKVRATLPNLDRVLGISANQSALADTFYPSAATAMAAQTVTTQAGRETANINIALIARRPVSISGVVRGLKSGYTFVMAMPTTNFRATTSTIQPGVDRFILKNLQPATYRLYAENVADGQRLRSPVFEVKLTDRDITDVTLTVGEMVKLTGRVTAPQDAPVSEIRFQPAIGAVGGPGGSAPVTAQGVFEIEKLPVERYHVTVVSTQKQAYVKRIALNGDPLPDSVLDLRQVGPNANIAVTVAIGSRLTGSVSGAQEGSYVILRPVEEPGPIEPKRATVSDKGVYAFDGLPPGRYRLLATDPLFNPVPAQEEADVVQKRGESIEIAGPGEIVKDLKVAK
jgi:Carboxypeptidase regulatory-like domain